MPHFYTSPHRWTACLVLTGFWLLAAPAAAECEPPPGRNHLACETSPYLLQHQSNPVDWYPWGQAAFDKAREEDKFIFLSIGYSTCYWCHVMERESFADPEIARLLNQHAVSIKVDREERPDVDSIYMTAVQLMTGRGGWPMTTLLTPDLKPFFGGTYLPKSNLRELLVKAQALWEQDRSALERQAEHIAEQMRRAGGLPGEPLAELPAAGSIDAAVEQYAQAFDAFDGGFGPAPKFPQPSILELLLTHHETRGDEKSLQMVTTTLDAMARGGIHDQVGGGFHRYSTDPQWLVPHFEKMLYDNAQLLHTYARAWKLTGNQNFKRVAGDIVAYVRREMTGADGLFHSAQDSEVDTEEGKSYVWTREQLKQVLTDAESALASRVWGLEGPPDFEGAHILHWPRSYAETAREEGLSVAELQARLEPIRAKLLAARNKREQPHLDDKAITAWNGLMIEALAYAGEVLDRPDDIALAERAAGALLKTLRDDSGRLLHVARHGRAKLDAYLDDYAATILALLALDRVSDDPRWRAEALGLADAMIAQLWDPAGGFHYAPREVEHLLVRSKDSYDGAMPSGNSLAVRALVRLAREIDTRYAGHAAAALRAFGPMLEDSPRALPYMLHALAGYRQAGLPPDAVPEAGPAPALATTADKLRVRVEPDPDDPRRFVTVLQLAEGWHVNATPASLEFLIPTRISAHRKGQALAIKASYPKGESLDAGLGEPVRVYHDGVRIPARLPAPPDPDTEVTVRAQACNDSGRCLAPADIRTRLTEAAE